MLADFYLLLLPPAWILFAPPLLLMPFVMLFLTRRRAQDLDRFSRKERHTTNLALPLVDRRFGFLRNSGASLLHRLVPPVRQFPLRRFGIHSLLSPSNRRVVLRRSALDAAVRAARFELWPFQGDVHAPTFLGQLPSTHPRCTYQTQLPTLTRTRSRAGTYGNCFTPLPFRHASSLPPSADRPCTRVTATP